MHSLQYASPLSKGTLATRIGWIDFGRNFTLGLSNVQVPVVNRMRGGLTIRFNLSAEIFQTSKGVNIPTFTAARLPAVLNAPFGTVYDKGIKGYPALTLKNDIVQGKHCEYVIYLEDIEVLDWNGNKVSDYTMYIADAGITNKQVKRDPNIWRIMTDGGNFAITQQIPSISGETFSPILYNQGWEVMEKGDISDTTTTASYVYSTTSPKELTGTFVRRGGNAAYAYGIIINQPNSYLRLTEEGCKYDNSLIGTNANYFGVPKEAHLVKVKYQGTTILISRNPVTITGVRAVYVISSEGIVATPLATPTGTEDVFYLMYDNICGCCNECNCCTECNCRTGSNCCTECTGVAIFR